MARYGMDYGRGGYGGRGYGYDAGYGATWRDDVPRGGYIGGGGRESLGGMRSDNVPGNWGGREYGTRDAGEFTPGGGAYDAGPYRGGGMGRGYDAGYGYGARGTGRYEPRYGGPGWSSYEGAGYGGMETDLGRGGYGYGGYGTGRGLRGDLGRSGRSEALSRRASDLMTENPESVTPDTSLADAAKKMRELDVGIIPVVDAGESRRLRGVITDRDIAVRAVAEGKDAKSTKVSDCMTAEVRTCNKNDSVEDVMRVMRDSQVRRVPITDRENRLVGIVAQADLAVDLDDSPDTRTRVEETVERISQPGRPGRATGMRASQARGQA